MTLETTLERIVTKQRKAESGAAEKYESLVRRITDDGHEPSEKEVSTILMEANKSADDLLADVRGRQQRIEWRAKADELPGLIEREKELRAEIERLDAELDAAQVRHREAVQPLAYELQTIGQQQAAARNANGALASTYVGPLRDRETKVGQELAKLADRRAVVRREIESRQAAAAVEAETAQRERSIVHSTNIGPDIHAVNRAESEAARHTEAAKKAQDELADLDRQQKELDLEVVQVRRQMLEA